jgi:hypothetical protein
MEDEGSSSYSQKPIIISDSERAGEKAATTYYDVRESGSWVMPNGRVDIKPSHSTA